MSTGQSITQSGDVIPTKTSDVGFAEDIKRLALQSILTQLSANKDVSFIIFLRTMTKL